MPDRSTHSRSKIWGNTAGFTQVEKIVTIAIAVVLIIVNIFLFLFLNNRVEDLQVLSDINQIRSAVELNYSINTTYPQQPNIILLNDRDLGTEKLCVRNFSSFTAQCDKVILHRVPNSLQDSGNQYYYQTPIETEYLLQFNLHYNYKRYGLVKGPNCATREGLQPVACFTPEELNGTAE